MLRAIRHYVGEIFRMGRLFYFRRMGVEMGQHVFISWGAWIDVRSGQVKIGNRVTITNGCKILSHDHARHLMKMPQTAITEIEDDVFIGMNSIILPGVLVGKGAIIGAGSIVARNVPSYSLVVGTAARVLKRFDAQNNTWIPVSED